MFCTFQLEDLDLIDIIGALDYVTKKAAVFSRYNVDRYITAYGLCVNPEYRGRGIATEILKSRAKILKAFNLTITATVFTGIGSQTAAKKAGYEEVYEISYADLEKILERFDFSKSLTKTLKLQALRL